MTTQEWVRFLIQYGVRELYDKTNPYWAHPMICRWHREDGLVVWDLPPYHQ
jgi:hypothetical protein